MGHGGGFIGKVLNPIGAYRDHKERKAEKAAERKQAEYDAKIKASQANADQAARKSRGDNLADIEGLQADDAGGMPGGDLSGLGEGGAGYTLKKRKTLGGIG